MKLPIACLSVWFLLGVPVLAMFGNGLFPPPPPPPPGWDNREARNPTQHAPEQYPRQQVLSRLDVLEAAQKSERSKYGEIENRMNSIRKDVARHSSGIARMDIFAETVIQRLMALEGKQTEKDTRKWTEQGQANIVPETPNNQRPKRSDEETSQVSDTDKGSRQHTDHTRTTSREEGDEEEAPRVESTSIKPNLHFKGVSPLCLTSSPPSRQSAEFNKTVTGSGVVAKYKCKNGYFNIGGDVHVSKCDTEGKWSEVDISCNNFTTCTYRYGSRMVYGGTLSTTKKGRTCQKWSSFKPHSHPYKPISFGRTTWTGPESLDDVSNYCRDPGLMHGSGKLWCYTTDPHHRWETCKVPECTVT